MTLHIRSNRCVIKTGIVEGREAYIYHGKERGRLDNSRGEITPDHIYFCISSYSIRTTFIRKHQQVNDNHAMPHYSRDKEFALHRSKR